MKERGQSVTSKLVDFTCVIPPLRIAQALLSPIGVELPNISRLLLVDDVPVALNISCLNLPEDIEITEEEMNETNSLWVLLEQIKGLFLLSSDKTLEAISATEEYTDLLETGVGDPLMLEEGVVYGADHMPVEFHQILTSSDRHKYYIHLDR